MSDPPSSHPLSFADDGRLWTAAALAALGLGAAAVRGSGVRLGPLLRSAGARPFTERAEMAWFRWMAVCEAIDHLPIEVGGSIPEIMARWQISPPSRPEIAVELPKQEHLIAMARQLRIRPREWSDPAEWGWYPIPQTYPEVDLEIRRREAEDGYSDSDEPLRFKYIAQSVRGAWRKLLEGLDVRQLDGEASFQIGSIPIYGKQIQITAALNLCRDAEIESLARSLGAPEAPFFRNGNGRRLLRWESGRMNWEISCPDPDHDRSQEIPF